MYVKQIYQASIKTGTGIYSKGKYVFKPLKMITLIPFISKTVPMYQRAHSAKSKNENMYNETSQNRYLVCTRLTYNTVHTFFRLGK